MLQLGPNRFSAIGFQNANVIPLKVNFKLQDKRQLTALSDVGVKILSASNIILTKRVDGGNLSSTQFLCLMTSESAGTHIVWLLLVSVNFSIPIPHNPANSILIRIVLTGWTPITRPKLKPNIK